MPSEISIMRACSIPMDTIEKMRAHAHGCPFCIQKPKAVRVVVNKRLSLAFIIREQQPLIPLDSRCCPHVDQEVERYVWTAR